MNKKLALRIVGGLSDPGKMPCFGYSLPASACVVGSRLREVKGSVCEKCYAHKGRYGFPMVQNALHRRLKAIRKKRWTESMIFLLKDQEYFRWHDSGDIQDEEHFNKMLDVIEGTPNTKHWIPTREYKLVEDVLKKRTLPNNVSLRLSAHMIDESGPILLAKRLGCQTSEVGSHNYTCPAPDQGNKCADCRNCWDTKVFNVTYYKH